MFKDGDEILFIDDKGQRTEVEITNAIRQGTYQYFYEDRNALLDRRQKFQEAFTMLNSAGQNPELAARIDWIEALKTGLEMTGFDNPDKFFKSEEESQIDQAANYIKQLPEPFQMEIMQTVQPMLQRANVLMQQQGGNNGEGSIYQTQGV